MTARKENKILKFPSKTLLTHFRNSAIPPALTFSSLNNPISASFCLLEGRSALARQILSYPPWSLAVVKKFLASAAIAAAGFGAGCLFLTTAWGDANSSPSAKQIAPTRIALIDMGYVFKNYKKFEDLKKDVNDAAQMAQEKAKGYIQQAQALQEEMKSGTYAGDSPEYLDRERQIIQLSSKFETFKALSNKDLVQRNAQTHKAVYEDVVRIVNAVAERDGYTLVMQFNRDAQSGEDPQKVSQAMARQIVFSQSQDDISDIVLNYLNRKYESSAGTPASKPTSPEKAPIRKSTPAPAKK